MYMEFLAPQFMVSEEHLPFLSATPATYCSERLGLAWSLVRESASSRSDIFTDCTFEEQTHEESIPASAEVGGG